MIFNADFLDPSFINESVCIRKSMPHTVAIIAELIPVTPIFTGNKPNGIKTSVYIIMLIAVFKSFLPLDGSSLNPAFL